MVMSAGGSWAPGEAEVVVGEGVIRGGGVVPSGRAEGNTVAFGRGVDVSSSVFGFARGTLGVSDGVDFFPSGFAVSSSFSWSSSELPGFFAAGVFVGSGSSLSAEVLLPVFDFFLAGFGFAAGDADFAGVVEGIVCISSRAFRNASRFFLSSSLICACSRDVTAPLSATAANKHVARRARPLLARDTGCSFKRAEAPPQPRRRELRRAPVPGEGLRSTFRPGGAASR